MFPTSVIDIFATKGIEYLVVIGYLAMLAGFWWLLTWATHARRRAEKPGYGWFDVPDGVWLHDGHTWLRPDHGRVAVGLDRFAAKLLGTPSRVELPVPGSRVRRGEPALRVERGGHTIEVCSPVSGEVIRVNEALEGDLATAWRQPYGDGWLLEVSPEGGARALRGLRQGVHARRFVDDAAAQLVERLPSPGGVALQDGGEPVDGLAEAVAGERWPELVGELLGARRTRRGAEGR